MTKETIYCDRCGKECEKVRNNRGFHLVRKQFLLRNTDAEFFDLCQQCYDELAKWMKRFDKCSECKYKDADLCKTEPLHEEDEDGNCIDFVPEKKYTPPMPKEKWRKVKPGWMIVPKCSTCKYLKSPIVPCNRCRDNSEYVPKNEEDVRKESE